MQWRIIRNCGLPLPFCYVFLYGAYCLFGFLRDSVLFLYYTATLENHMGFCCVFASQAVPDRGPALRDASSGSSTAEQDGAPGGAWCDEKEGAAH